MCFLPRNLLATVAKIRLVVNIDTGNNCTIRVDKVDRIQPPSQAHLEYGDIKIAVLEQQQGSKRGIFKIRQGNFFPSRFYPLELLHNHGISSRLTGYPYALIKVN